MTTSNALTNVIKLLCAKRVEPGNEAMISA